MPSERKQINVRMDEETTERVDRLLLSVSTSLGIKVSQSDLFRLGMIELEKKFPTVGEEQPAATGKGKKAK